jgi:hypothetical protein
MLRALVCVALAACSTPDLKIVFTVADGNFGPACGAVDCTEVPMACESVLHLRVQRPSDPTAPLVSVCTEVRPNNTQDLCAIGQVDLPPTRLPRETLEIQITVWPLDMLLDPDTGRPDCGKGGPIEFDAAMGFPVPVLGGMNPAFGGRAFYQPGDEETVVTLGCVDVGSINEASCVGGADIQVTATVGDFENLPFSVSPTVGDRLLVSIGEPIPFEGRHQLAPANLHALERTVDGPTPVWSGGVDRRFASTACIQVFEDVGQATSSLRCRNVLSLDNEIDLPGVRLPKTTLDGVLAALSMTSFPREGLTIGIVLDHVGNPAANRTIFPTQGTIEYLDPTRTALAPGSTTTSSGMFVSRDAPYGTVFTTSQVNQTINALGGRVNDKVTVVILQFDEPVIGD